MGISLSRRDHKPIPKIPALKDPVILYVDTSTESLKVKTLLEEAGISPYLTTGQVGPLERRPLVLYDGGIYQGLDEIRSLIHLLDFWTGQPTCSLVFQDEKACKTLP